MPVNSRSAMHVDAVERRGLRAALERNLRMLGSELRFAR